MVIGIVSEDSSGEVLSLSVSIVFSLGSKVRFEMGSKLAATSLSKVSGIVTWAEKSGIDELPRFWNSSSRSTTSVRSTNPFELPIRVSITVKPL